MPEKIVMLLISDIIDYEEQPFKVREDEEMDALVDRNLQRENISPSERAFAYKLKYDAQKRQGERTDLTSGHDVPKWEDFDKSDRQVRRYIRLT